MWMREYLGIVGLLEWLGWLLTRLVAPVELEWLLIWLAELVLLE